MARGNRTYKRDANGRFASTGGGGKRSRPAATRVAKGPNRLTRDNSGKITSVGGNGATARGGRLRTASGNLRATQTTRIAGGRAGMVGKGGKLKGSKVLSTTRLTDNSRVPASQRPGSMTNTLRSVMGSLAKQDAKRIREVEAITGQKARAPRSSGSTAAANRMKAAGAGSKSVSQTLRAGLRELAQSDARTMRGMAEIVRNSTPKLPGGRKSVGAGKAKALGPAKGKSVAMPSATKTPFKRTGQIMRQYRYRPPATTMKYKEAVPVTNANRPRLNRARDVMQRSISGNVGFAEMQKLRTRAGVAANPYSNMSAAQRTRAVNDLAKAELQNKKASKSYGIGAKAEDIYTNLAGYTQGEGRKKWRRAGQRTTSLGAGTIRGGVARNPNLSRTPSGPTPRRSRSRQWYESKGKASK